MSDADTSYLCRTAIRHNVNRDESRHTIHSIACLDDIGRIEHVPIHELVLWQPLRHNRVAKQVADYVRNAASQVTQCVGSIKT